MANENPELSDSHDMLAAGAASGDRVSTRRGRGQDAKKATAGPPYFAGVKRTNSSFRGLSEPSSRECQVRTLRPRSGET